jgi:hypothetical protein
VSKAGIIASKISAATTRERRSNACARADLSAFPFATPLWRSCSHIKRFHIHCRGKMRNSLYSNKGSSGNFIQEIIFLVRSIPSTNKGSGWSRGGTRIWCKNSIIYQLSRVCVASGVCIILGSDAARIAFLAREVATRRVRIKQPLKQLTEAWGWKGWVDFFLHRPTVTSAGSAQTFVTWKSHQYRQWVENAAQQLANSAALWWLWQKVEKLRAYQGKFARMEIYFWATRSCTFALHKQKPPRDQFLKSTLDLHLKIKRQFVKCVLDLFANFRNFWVWKTIPLIM